MSKALSRERREEGRKAGVGPSQPEGNGYNHVHVSK